MARPPPRIIRETILGNTWRHLTIAESPGFYVVVYQGRPFNFVTQVVSQVRDTTRKYPKTGFALKGHADGLARKLNHWFDTTDFTVINIFEGDAHGSRPSKNAQS